LIVALPSRMRDSLALLLASVLDRIAVRLADDCCAANRIMVEQRPALVLLDTNLPGEDVWSLLESMGANGSRSRCLVLADSVRQQKRARSAGADAALLKGYPAVELYAVVENLLDEWKAECERGGVARAEQIEWETT
jgi:DNA-binding response OmpR family regulator